MVNAVKYFGLVGACYDFRTSFWPHLERL